MTSLIERYLAAALRGIPEGQRADVERELRSSIADAVEDRVTAGEDRSAAERAVLEGLGDPATLAAGYAGRPMYLIGPELFPVYRHVLTMLLPIAIPIVAVVLTTVALAGQADYIDAVLRGVGGAVSVGIQLVFWVTATFAFLERADVARGARSEIAAATGRWKVEMLPEPKPNRISAGETVGEVLTTLIGIGGLLFLRDTSWFTGADGAATPILDPELGAFWVPLLIALLVWLAAVHVIVYFLGRWTMPLASAHAVLQLAYAVPVVWGALSGSLINPAFAAELGWPGLANGNGWPMLSLAAVVVLVTGWEIIDAFRKIRRSAAVTAPA